MNLRAGPQGHGAFGPADTVTCRYFARVMNGRSPKFMCRTADGDELKVKFGRHNGEVYGEVLATRLLWALGFGADRMYTVRVICRGCPDALGGAALPNGDREFEPTAVERKAAGREIVLRERSGWSWPELDLVDERVGGSPRAHRDALILLAVFMQHTDTKPEQQRIVCLDEACAHPLLMVSDVGLTFGRANLANDNAIGSVNLQEWAAMPVWKDPIGCVGNLPKSLTGTLRDPVISEEGRGFLAHRLDQLSDRQLRDLFEGARVNLRSNATVDEWMTAFKAKRAQIAERRCVDPWWTNAPPAFSSMWNLRMQAWSSPALTTAMNAVSWLGYTRGYLALAVLIALAYRLAPGAGLLVMLALCAVLTDATKAVAAFPRPNVVDARVIVMGDFGDTLDGYGFPSGHVASTTTFMLGLVLLCGWRWGWLAAAIWVTVMAGSRIYLGRHFLGDTIGGLAIGVVTAAIGVQALTLQRLWHERFRSAIWRVALAASVLTVLVAVTDVPADYDVGRLFGIAASLVMLAPAFERLAAEDAAGWIRLARVLLAAACYGAGWFATQAALVATGTLHTPLGAFIAGAVPAAIVLPGPLYVTAVWREPSGFEKRTARPT